MSTTASCKPKQQAQLSSVEVEWNSRLLRQTFLGLPLLNQIVHAIVM